MSSTPRWLCLPTFIVLFPVCTADDGCNGTAIGYWLNLTTTGNISRLEALPCVQSLPVTCPQSPSTDGYIAGISILAVLLALSVVVIVLQCTGLLQRITNQLPFLQRRTDAEEHELGRPGKATRGCASESETVDELPSAAPTEPAAHYRTTTRATPVKGAVTAEAPAAAAAAAADDVPEICYDAVSNRGEFDFDDELYDDVERDEPQKGGVRRQVPGSLQAPPMSDGESDHLYEEHDARVGSPEEYLPMNTQHAKLDVL